MVEAKAVIFDFDGLLMDTESTMVASWQQEWRWHGLELDLSDFWPGHGGDVTADRYDRLAAAVGPSYDREESDRRRLAHREELHDALELRAGLWDWLTAAQAAGVALAIASSSPRWWVVRHLTRVDALTAFDVIAAGDEVDAHKPDPSVYHLALSRLGVSAADAVAVEDTPHGVTAAQAAGLPCIAIPNPYIAAEWVGHADLVLGSAAEIGFHQVLRLAGPRQGGTGTFSPP